MSVNDVTGARVDVAMTVEMSPERFWALITDVSRIGEWSPEVVKAAWLEGDAAAPRVGDRFKGSCEYPDGFAAVLQCVVTESEPGRAFSWVVLDGDADPERPGSIWSYELRPGSSPDTTLVRHSFEHGTGTTGLRTAIEGDPANAEARLEGRLDQLRMNMTSTLDAMARG
jgi:uncharacterized protein YndB with AHSA1/START domain